MWHTAAGLRTLSGAEAALVRESLEDVAQGIQRELEGCARVGRCAVPIFHALRPEQKLALLCEVGEALLLPETPVPDLNALNEATVGVLYENIEHRILAELENDTGPEQSRYYWRRLVLATLEESRAEAEHDPFPDGVPDIMCRDRDEWILFVECLTDRVLWDNDWMDGDVYLDLPPEHAKKLKRMMGVTEDYYTAIPPDPSERELGGIRNRLRVLTDG